MICHDRESDTSHLLTNFSPEVLQLCLSFGRKYVSLKEKTET